MLLELWLTAYKAEVGIAVSTDNRKLLKQHLYKARAESNKPELNDMVILIPDVEDELWLVHKDADTPGTGDQGNNKPIHQRLSLVQE